MESSIAVFLLRHLASEQLPTLAVLPDLTLGRRTAQLPHMHLVCVVVKSSASLSAAVPELNVGSKFEMISKNLLHFSSCACRPCAGAMLIFSVSFRFERMILERCPILDAPYMRRGTTVDRSWIWPRMSVRDLCFCFRTPRMAPCQDNMFGNVAQVLWVQPPPSASLRKGQ